jgi:hypothetical protein
MAKGASSFAIHDRVQHKMYGTGTITELNDRHTTILFDEAGRKKFLTSMVDLEPSDTLAPVKPASRRKARPSP